MYKFSTIYLALFWIFSCSDAAYLYHSHGASHSKRDEKNPFQFRLYNHNIRYDAPKVVTDEKPWGQRRDACIASIQSRCADAETPTIVTLQEVLVNQLNDIKYGLNGNVYSRPWAHFGTGRNDGAFGGEFSPVLYNTEIWDLVNGTQRWISYTPDEPTYFPNTEHKRVITLCTFTHKKTGVGINVINTHFDHKSSASRNYGAGLILRYTMEFGNNYPTVVGGDLNSEMTDPAYLLLAGALDSAAEVASRSYNKQLSTASGFSPKKRGTTIDFIFATRGNIVTNQYKVLQNAMDDIYRFSDHRPIIADFTI
ncbi:uncharacterized protein J8A68_001947 [[Candida] subhashii]|uniref:Endonuclease/exonuclease/phosphatase domain-containing protein n=1 Tax=[Candida] subhashii TaxID=561895 RepID=A0A8J5QH04_9ASCO|nr:uncharacterized protein J8A68_001947 [[Candida] subhashii]KAG7664521.1 hypothetical protein J8A68_001947 [[Candida] subhashii]